MLDAYAVALRRSSVVDLIRSTLLVAVGVGSAIARPEPAERRALVAAVRSLA
jgi:hypothetical protein